MPPSAQEGSNAAKTSSGETNSTNKEPQQKPAAALEEDDEFEDFPVEGQYFLRTWGRSTLTTRCRLGRGGYGIAEWESTSLGGKLG